MRRIALESILMELKYSETFIFCMFELIYFLHSCAGDVIHEGCETAKHIKLEIKGALFHEISV